LCLVEIRRFCCSHVSRESDACPLFSILDFFLQYITIILVKSKNYTLSTLNRNAILAFPIFFV
jgi:hypothetical protein